MWLLLHKFWSHLEYFESSITTKNANFRLSSTWSWHAYTTTFTINVNCICCEKGKDKTVFVTENFWSQSGSLFVTKNFWSRTDSPVTSAESSEQFWCKMPQIWRICEPWIRTKESHTSPECLVFLHILSDIWLVIKRAKFWTSQLKTL